MKTDLYTGDCLDILPTLPENSVQLIVTSPPYAQQRKSTYGGVHPDDYVDWFLPRAAEMMRVLAPDGTFILNIKEHVSQGERHTYVHDLVSAIRAQGWLWTEEYIWHKTTSMPGKWSNRFRDGWEHLFQFNLQRKFTMHQEEVMVPTGDWAKSRLANLSEQDMACQESATGSGMNRKMSAWVGRELAYPTNVLHGPPECGNKGHPATFPLWLPAWFIRLFTKPGDTVLDPFSGSGTTVLAADVLDRQGIGIDRDIKYNGIALARLVTEVGKARRALKKAA